MASQDQATIKRQCSDCGSEIEVVVPVGAGMFTRFAMKTRCNACQAARVREFDEADRAMREATMARQRMEMLANSAVPTKFLADKERLDGFDPVGNEEAYAVVLDYLDGFPKSERPFDYPSMIIYSRNNGVGKTRLSCGIVRALIEAWRRDDRNQSPYIFRSMSDVRLEIQMGLRFQAQKTAEEVYNDCKHAWLLVLDDVGKEAQFRADDAEVYYKIVNDRYNMQLPTIVTANLHPTTPWVKGGLSLEDVMGLATMSRLKEMCQGKVVEIKGEDRR